MSVNDDLETRVEIDSVPGRMLMALDEDGNKRFVRCDENGFLLCKVADAVDGEMDE